MVVSVDKGGNTMSLLFNSIPLEILSTVVLFATILVIYGIIDLEKRKPGHPFKYALISLNLASISILISKWFYQSSLLSIYFDFFDKVSTILTCTSFLVLIITMYLAYKCGYISEKGKQLLTSTLFPCIIVVFLGILLIAYGYFLPE